MKKKFFLLGLCLLFCAPSHAFLAAIAEGADKAREEAYRQFMMLKAVQQLKMLRDNYTDARELYAMAKKMNEGRGLMANILDRVGDIGEETAQKIQGQFKYDWLTSKPERSRVSDTLREMDLYVSDKIRYAGKVFEVSRQAETEAAKLASESHSLDPKASRDAALKAQALQLQLSAQQNANLANLLDVDTRLYDLMLKNAQRDLRETVQYNQAAESYFKSFSNAPAAASQQ